MRILKRFISSSISCFSQSLQYKHGLYVVPTPIGNLNDLSTRSLQVLKNVDIIAAEDTRHTAKLLHHFNILGKTVLSYYTHNSYKQTDKLVELAKAGNKIALVSDAGTPGICDPGAELVSAFVKENIPVYPIPGPSALTAALSICGFDVSKFTFHGFLPVKGKLRQNTIQTIKSTSHVVIFFEAPHRLLRTLTELSILNLDKNNHSKQRKNENNSNNNWKMKKSKNKSNIISKDENSDNFNYNENENDEDENIDDIMIDYSNSDGNFDNEDEHSQRLCVCCREISKIYEEVWRGTVKDARIWVQNMIENNNQKIDNENSISNNEGRIRGEYTIILGPWIKKKLSKEEMYQKISEMLEKLNEDGIRRSEAISILSEESEIKNVWGIKKSEIYKLSYSLDWE